MRNISRIIAKINKLTGTSARMTLGKQQILEAVGKKDTQAAEKLAKIFGKMKNPQVDVAYKASERGFVVGAVNVRDGKKILANGAASVTGLGSQNPVFKMRLNGGKNGEIFSHSSFYDLAHSPTVQNIEFTSTLKNGVLESAGRNGNFGAARTRLDIPKAVEAAGFKEEGALAAKKVNQIYEDLIQIIRNNLS